MSTIKKNMDTQSNTVTDALVSIKKRIESQIDEKQKALPEGFQKERFVQNCLIVLKNMKGIQDIDVNSVSRTLLQAAFLGLDFLSKECYAIAYYNKHTNSYEINFQTDYKGEVKLAKKYSINPIKEIYAKVVREGDDFQEIITDGKQSINFIPRPFSDKIIIGAFAVVLYADGSMMYEVMSSKEINSVKDNYSKSKNSEAWSKSEGEMYKKTVLRRLCKHISLDFKSTESQQAWDISSDMVFNDKEEQKAQVAASSLDLKQLQTKEPVEEMTMEGPENETN
jgi:recombination protein RecT